MKKSLYFYMSIVIFGVICFFVATAIIAHQNNLRIAENMVIETSQIATFFFRQNMNQYMNQDTNQDANQNAAQNVTLESTSPALNVQTGGTTRITIISSTGEVLADSTAWHYRQHTDYLLRPEIAAAAHGTPAVYRRYSQTLGVDFIYYAVKVEHHGEYIFIRTAIAVEQITAYIRQILPIVIFLLLALTITCILLARSMASRILKPMYAIDKKLRRVAGGDFTDEPTPKSYEEVEKIITGIDDIALTLKENFSALHSEKNKLSYILNSISDGIFVMDENTNIALVNAAALQIFNATADVAGKKLNYLVADKTLLAAAEDCLQNTTSALFEYAQAGKIFLVTIKPLPDTNLTMVAMADITQTRENAQRREEFFANASHELKTPLTAIKGFNELTAINNNNEALSKYIDGITRETARMMSLISDMLKLSELENTREVTAPVEISLAQTVAEVHDIVANAATEKAILFETQGDAIITAEPKHIFEIVKNLIENAVRYNTKGGKVAVTIKSGNSTNITQANSVQTSHNHGVTSTNTATISITITDNGIGIPPDEQTKIFERFYRVEKSRSSQNGGTGLGLSIVKHICALYGWKLSLKSKLGVGTDVTVDFT